MNYELYEAEVFKIEDETPDVKRFHFKIGGENKFEFKAGQFVMFDIPLETTIISRSYSIASAPNNDNTFEICAALKSEGLATPWLWHHVTIGSKLKCSSPVGKFLLPETIDVDLCFIATGTGIAPLRSMILDIYHSGRPHKNIYLIFGNRWEKNILYRAEFEQLQHLHPEFTFIPVLSRETAETWKGALGYVHSIYMQLFSDNRKAYFYLCGWSAMIKEARLNLKERGYTKQEIKFEVYD